MNGFTCFISNVVDGAFMALPSMDIDNHKIIVSEIDYLKNSSVQ